MKTKLPVIAVVAILVSACTTGTYMTRSYDDDIYFSPADMPPVAIVDDETPANKKSARINNSDTRDQKVIISQMDKNADGTSAVNNYIYEPEQENRNSDYQAYDMDDQNLVESDTTVYYNDDDVKYVVNNYYDDNDNDIDFAYRINRFHRPYYYSPFFYDDWAYGYYSPFYSGWGWDPWYYGGWGYPYSYYGYYSPFSIGFGFGGYWGGGYGGYYGGYGGYYGGGVGFYNDRQVAKRRSTNMNVPGGGLNNNNVVIGGRSPNLKSGRENQSGGQLNNTTGPNTWVENGHVRSRSINTSGNNQDTKSATIVNDRRTNTNNTGSQVQESSRSRTPQTVRPETNTSGNVRRSYTPTTTGRTYDQGRTVRQSQNYTPSYNKPRIVNQSNYNNNSYTRPRTIESGNERTTIRSTSPTGTSKTYSAPKSSSNLRQTYRSSSSYSNGSSSSPSRSSSSYSRPASSSGSSYSAPARSSSGSSSGSSSTSGSSRGSSSGSSGGGSGHRR